MHTFVSCLAAGPAHPVPSARCEPGAWNPDALDWNTLPAGLRELRKLMGSGPTILLAEAFGGAALYVPCRVHPSHPLAACIGAPAAKALAEVFGGDKLHVPKVDAIERQVRAARLQRMRQAGASIAELAREHHLTPRRVRQILAAARQAASS